MKVLVPLEVDLRQLFACGHLCWQKGSNEGSLHPMGGCELLRKFIKVQFLPVFKEILTSNQKNSKNHNLLHVDSQQDQIELNLTELFIGENILNFFWGIFSCDC